jgi:nitrate reductase gamma subunit
MNGVLFIAIPYLALALAIGGGIWRYRRDRFSYSSLSSQLLEQRKLFWGSVAWHYGILPILLAHLVGGLFPSAWGWVLGGRWRLAVLEWLGLSLALLTVFGIVLLFLRRVGQTSGPRAQTSAMDWVLLVLLALQVVTGDGTALLERWGSLWYLQTAVPWFWSLVGLDPEYATIAALPAVVQFHMVNGFVVIGLFPFTRLVHVVAVPLDYLWRPYQVVLWTRPRHRARPAP